jgi:hypothetical protein
MRAHEFITESTAAKTHGNWGALSSDVNAALPGVWVQRQLRNTDPYMQYRYGLAMAAARAVAAGEVKFHQESSWAENLTIVGYTPEDEQVIALADKLMGVNGTRIADSKIYESDTSNIASPVAKIKRNSYGV